MLRLPGPVLLIALGCAAPPPAAERGAPYMVVLGTAQDGGLPQIGCTESCCRQARERPELRRMVTSLLLADPRSGKRWLFDASPDLPEQVERARPHPPGRPRPPRPGRPPLFDGVFLTHAHTGHYTGLVHLSQEAYGSRGLPVFGTERMTRFLTENGPWSLMVASGGIVPTTLTAGEALELGDDLRVTPIAVPHRDEYTDTVAFWIEGPSRSLLYLPDIDKWERWGTPIARWIEAVDLALLDGTFFADGEIPGRSMADIPHPFIAESIERFGPLPGALRARVHFTHLNHSNPAARPGSAARVAVEGAGMSVAEDGQVFGL